MRLRTIYVPCGEAAEYADLAWSPYSGCSHGCRYCYGARVLWCWGEG